MAIIYRDNKEYFRKMTMMCRGNKVSFCEMAIIYRVNHEYFRKMVMICHGNKGCFREMTVMCRGSKGCFHEMIVMCSGHKGCFRKMTMICRDTEGCPSDVPRFLDKEHECFHSNLSRGVPVLLFREGWSSFAEFGHEVVHVLTDPMSFIANMFACFAVEGVLATKVVHGVSRPFARFAVTFSSVHRSGATFAATSFP